MDQGRASIDQDFPRVRNDSKESVQYRRSLFGAGLRWVGSSLLGRACAGSFGGNHPWNQEGACGSGRVRIVGLPNQRPCGSDAEGFPLEIKGIEGGWGRL